MEEILCCIGAAIFSILAVIFGVRRGTKSRTRGGIRNSRERLDNIIHNHKRLERDKERVEELDDRGDENIRRCNDIVSRIRKREQETPTSE